MNVRDDGSFWRGAVPGMFDMGAGIYGMQQGQREANQRVGQIQAAGAPAQGASNQALANAGSLDPRAHGAEWLKGQQQLLSGQDSASEDQMIRMLQARGMLGAANYNPGVEGITPNGTKMNPQMAAFYAARNARDAKMAAEAGDRGEQAIDRQINRSTQLQQQSNLAQNAARQNQQLRPSKAAAGQQLLGGIGSVLKNPDVMKGIGGMLSGGIDWLSTNNPFKSFDFTKDLDLSSLNFGFNDLDFS